MEIKEFEHYNDLWMFVDSRCRRALVLLKPDTHKPKLESKLEVEFLIPGEISI